MAGSLSHPEKKSVPNLGNYRREALVCAQAALIYSLAFLLSGSKLGVHDWELFTAMAEIPRVIVLKFGQFPFWNPYIGGGNILFHHPEVSILSPFFALTLAFGAVIGLKLQFMVCYFLGFWGSVRFARALGMSESAGYLFASIYFGSAFFALHFSEGHIPFTHFAFLPWVAYFWLKSLSESRLLSRYVIYGAITLALMILGNGAAAPFLYTSTFIGSLAALFPLREKSPASIYRMTLIWVFGLGVAAIKFIPMFVYLQNNFWAGEPLDIVPLKALSAVFFSFDQGLFSHRELGLAGGWHEYGAFIFFPALLLGAWYALRNFSRSWIWLALALFFFLHGLGGFAEWSPWRLLGYLPGFSSSRAPGRSFQFVILALGVLAGFGLDLLRTRIISARQKSKAKDKTLPAVLKNAPAIFIVSIVAVNGWVALQSLSQPFVRESVSGVWQEDFKQTVGRPDAVYQSVLENRGVILAPWLSAYQQGRGLVTSDGVVLDEYIDSGSAEVLSRSYRGSEIECRLRADSAGEIILGMGFDLGWQIIEPANSSLRAEQDLLAVSFPAGESIIFLRYRTPYFYLGLIISLLSVCVLAVLLMKLRRSVSHKIQD